MDGSQALRVLMKSSPGRPTRAVKFDGLELLSVTLKVDATFERCSFVGTDLRHCTMDHAFFKMCDMAGANLRGASLRGAHFAGCDLQGADLRDTDLTGAHFTFVNTGVDAVGRSNLTGAKMLGAKLKDLSAERVIGWLSARVG